MSKLTKHHRRERQEAALKRWLRRLELVRSWSGVDLPKARCVQSAFTNIRNLKHRLGMED